MPVWVTCTKGVCCVAPTVAWKFVSAGAVTLPAGDCSAAVHQSRRQGAAIRPSHRLTSRLKLSNTSATVMTRSPHPPTPRTFTTWHLAASVTLGSVRSVKKSCCLGCTTLNNSKMWAPNV
jgi:hypothetical protein